MSQVGARLIASAKEARGIASKAAELPYGVYKVGEREVLFNRGYEPIWQRVALGEAEPADRKEWVAGIEAQEWFYQDLDPPWFSTVPSRASLRRCREALDAFAAHEVLPVGVYRIDAEGKRWRNRAGAPDAWEPADRDAPRPSIPMPRTTL